MSGTTGLAECLDELRQFFDGRGWDYCVIGGHAAIHWGEPRLTMDVDLVVLVEAGDEAVYVDAMLAAFQTRLSDGTAKEFALQNRVLLLKSKSGVPIDISLGILGFEKTMLSRAKRRALLPGRELPVATAEDIIAMKTIAGRPQDWRDIEGIIGKQRTKLDWEYIRASVGGLLELLEAPERASQLESLKIRVESSDSIKNERRRSNPSQGEAEY